MFQHTAARRRLEFQTAYQTKRSKFQHTAARRRLVENQSNTQPMKVFQHTAARRRLVTANGSGIARLIVSTHSRPKAAGRSRKLPPSRADVSTHSRPKAAGKKYGKLGEDWRFQHTAARRRLAYP